MNIRGRPEPELFDQKYLNMIRSSGSSNAQAAYKPVSSPLLPGTFVIYFIEFHTPSPGGMA